MSHVNILARWDSTNLDCVAEWRMYRQLRGAFGVHSFTFTPVKEAHSGVAIKQYDTFEEALEHVTGLRVFLEPSGNKSLSDIPPGQDEITLIVGNTEYSNAEHAQPGDLLVSIDAAEPTDLYGVNAVAIALAVLHGQ